MTVPSAVAPPLSTTAANRRAGAVCLVAGVLGAGSGLYLAVAEPRVPDSQFSYPLTAAGFVAIQLWFCVQHLGLLAGQVALRSSGVAGPGRAVAWGHGLGIAGMALLTLTELLAIAAADDPYPSSLTNVLDALYGVASLAIGVGLVIVGAAVRRVGAWTGWRAWLPLALGVWVFVPMTPAIMAGFLPARLAISAWMLLYAALGWALASQPAAGRSAH